MSRPVGDRLPPEMVGRLSIDQAVARADRVILLCTVDEGGWPHPAMLSHLEVVAEDAQTLRLVTYAASRTARALGAGGAVTIMLVDEGLAYYVKGTASPLAPELTSAPGVAAFRVRIQQVLADAADPREGAVAIVSGIRVARPGVDPDQARAVLRELLDTK